MLECHFSDELDAMNRGRETGDEEATPGAGEYFFKSRSHGALAGRVSRTLNIGRVLQQKQHAFLTVLGKLMEVEENSIRRRGVDFEIARVNYYTQRRMDSQCHTIDQTVRHSQRMNQERPN